MANDLSRNPWILDTATAITTQPVVPAYVRFAGAAGSAFVLQDNPQPEPANVAYGNADRVPRNILEDPSTQADSEYRFEGNANYSVVWNGLKLLSITAGKLYVYYR